MDNRNWSKIATLEEALNHGLTQTEFENIKDVLGRDINLVELGICSALYSEHCSYKSTKVHLSTLPTTGEKVLQGPGENAGIIDIGDNQGVVFKVESHNHPSFIEPFQGAATGVGGILRDVFTMGARPLALLNSLRFGSDDLAKTKYLLSGAVKGIGTYGNCMGIPTIGGELFFHKSYDGNCLVNAFALGLVEHDQIFLGTASGVGNPIFYVGSKTGRDGIHGATMASAEFDDNSDEKRPTVQVGDPFQEKLLLEACLEAMLTGAVVGIQDMGAAGMTSSSYEMAERAGTGLVINLDQVPQRDSNMNPYEIMLSESQERMLLVVEKGREAEIIEVFKHWELDVVQIGEVVEGENVDLFWHGENISSIPVKLLTSSVPQYRWPEQEPREYEARVSFDTNQILEPKDLSQVWINMLASANLCSRSPLYQQYDSTVRSNTVVHPGGDSAVIRIKSDSQYNLGDRNHSANEKKSLKVEKGVAITLDCNSRFCAIDPLAGAALSVAEAYRNISAVGALPLGVSDCLNFGSPEKPEGMWQIAEGIRGMGQACRALKTPIVSGNVSLYNETKGKAIYPTPLIAMVGLIDDANLAVSAFFKNSGDVILLLGETKYEIGGSEYLAQFAGIEKGSLPVLNYELETRTADLVRELVMNKLLQSCHDLSSGGLAIALAEACISDYHLIGAKIKAETLKLRKDALMFSETGARYLISCKPEHVNDVKNLAKKAGISVSMTGVVGGDKITIEACAELDLKQAAEVFKKSLEKLFN